MIDIIILRHILDYNYCNGTCPICFNKLSARERSSVYYNKTRYHCKSCSNYLRKFKHDYTERNVYASFRIKGHLWAYMDLNLWSSIYIAYYSFPDNYSRLTDNFTERSRNKVESVIL